MAKKATVLGIEGDALVGLRLETADGAPARGAAVSFNFAPEAPGDAAAEDDGGADPLAPGEDAPAPAEAASPAERMADAFAAAKAELGTDEVCLALPLSLFLSATIRIPAEERESLAERAAEAIAAISPFPDEPLSPGVEIVSETETEIVALAAALPDAAEEKAAAIGEALEMARVRAVRTEPAALGRLRGCWAEICGEDEDSARKTRAVLMRFGGEWDFALVAEGAPVLLRGIGAEDSPAGLAREVMLTIFANGARDVDEVVVLSNGAPPEETLEKLESFGPVRFVACEDPFAGAEGTALRSLDEDGAMDATPDSWREARAEARFRKRAFRALGAAAAVWLLLMGGIFGVDAVYDFRTSRVNSARNERAHKRAVKEVTATTNSVALIERYRDHAHGALEVLKTVSDLLPASDEMHLQSFSYKRGESVRLRGFAGTREENRDYQDALLKAAFDDETTLFREVKSSSNERQTRRGFPLDLECLFRGTGEGEDG